MKHELTDSSGEQANLEPKVCKNRAQEIPELPFKILVEDKV